VRRDDSASRGGNDPRVDDDKLVDLVGSMALTKIVKDVAPAKTAAPETPKKAEKVAKADKTEKADAPKEKAAKPKQKKKSK
jgi:hypothetical protein